jgi:hypothetical protein
MEDFADDLGISESTADFGTSESTTDFAYPGQDTLAFDFDVPIEPHACGAGLGDFDLSAGISSLDALSNMMCDSSNDTAHMALERPLYRVEKTFSPAHIAPFARSRVEWSIDKLKSAPRMMVEQNGTPWQHFMLYDEYMPRSLQDAHAACALYIARNGVNDDMVARFLRERVEELVSSPPPHQPTDLLARAHALMLFQIMLIFFGDYKLYSLAERLLPLMEEIGSALIPFAAIQVDPMGALPLYPSTHARAAWKAYMFRESIRRTILCLYHFGALCHLLRGSDMPCNNQLALGNRVTLSAHLWNAKSAFEFGVAWNDENHYLVEDLDFTEVMRGARPEDVDVFAKMIMVGLQGEDDIRGWLYTRGGIL